VTGQSLAGAPAPIPSADTIVVLMGVSTAAAIRDQLIAVGLAPSTPAAVVEWGTCDRQRAVDCTLFELPEAIARHGFGPPAILVIGEVVRLRTRLDWRRARALDLDAREQPCP
jgi:siroheme synthase